MNYLRRVLIAADQLINSIGGGMPDETISAKVHRKAKNGSTFCKKVLEPSINFIFQEKDHCKKSYESEIAGSQNHPEYQTKK